MTPKNHTHHEPGLSLRSRTVIRLATWALFIKGLNRTFAITTTSLKIHCFIFSITLSNIFLTNSAKVLFSRRMPAIGGEIM